MSDKKIVVPEGMLRAALDSNLTQWNRVVRIALENALLWLSENPIVPSQDSIKDQFPEWSLSSPQAQKMIEWWQRHMFLAPEPEEESAYMRVTKAMGAVTLSREEGEMILTYVRGAIHG